MTAMLPVGGAVGAAVLSGAAVVTAGEVAAAVVGAAVVAAVTQTHNAKCLVPVMQCRHARNLLVKKIVNRSRLDRIMVMCL